MARLRLLITYLIWTVCVHSLRWHHPIVCSASKLTSLELPAVLTWLNDIGLSQYHPIFESNHLAGTALESITSEQLQEYGIKPLGHRKKILAQLKKLNEESSGQIGQCNSIHPSMSDCSATIPSISSSSTPSPHSSSPSSPSSSSNIGRNVHASSDPATRTHLSHGIEDDSTTEDNGGWAYDEYGHQYDTDRCNIDIRTTDMTREEFEREFYLKKPVLIVPNAERRRVIQETRKHWSKQHLIEQHGEFEVTLGTPQQLTSYGDGRLKMSLEKYIHELENPTKSNKSIGLTHYLFDRNQFLYQCRELLTSYQAPSYFREDLNPIYSLALTFALGPTGTGINWHYHKDGWNEVIFGRKRWMLYPPTIGVPPFGYNQFESTRSWFNENYHKLSKAQLPYECMQYPGETMYVPEDWWHSVINIGETICVAGQTKAPAKGTIMELVSKGLAAGDQPGPKGQGLKYYQKVLELYPGFGQVHNLIGNVYRSMNQIPEAAAAYRKSFQANPKYAMAWSSLGQIELQLGEHAKALKYLTRALELGPEYFETLLGLGNLYLFREQLDKAIPYLQQAINVSLELSPPNYQQAHPAFVNLCVAYAKVGQSDKAITIAKEFLHYYPNDRHMLMAYANALRQIGGRAEEALAIYLQIQKQEPSYQPAFDEAERTREQIELLEEHESPSVRKKKSKPEKESSAESTLPSNPQYFSNLKQDNSGAYVLDNLPLKTMQSLKNWRQELVDQYISTFTNRDWSSSSANDSEEGRLLVYQTYSTSNGYSSLKQSTYGLECISFAPSSSNVRHEGCLTTGEIIPSFDDEVLNLQMFGEQLPILSLGAILRSKLTSQHDWIGFTSWDEDLMRGREKSFSEFMTGSSQSQSTFLDELYSLPYNSSFGSLEDAVVGLDGGPVAAHLPEYVFYDYLESRYPGGSEFLLKVFQKMGLLPSSAKDLPTVLPVPRGLTFHANRWLMSRATFEQFWKFQVLFLDAALLTLLPQPKPGKSFGQLMEVLPTLWALHSGRPMLYAQTFDYLHELRALNTKILSDQFVDSRWSEFVGMNGEHGLVRRYGIFLQPPVASPEILAQMRAEFASRPRPRLRRRGVSFPPLPLVVTMEASYELALAHPDTIRQLRAPEIIELISTPPILEDPVMPTFAGGTKELRIERRNRCENYMKTRVTSMAFQVGTYNAWMKSTGGRLWGELSVFEIQGERPYPSSIIRYPVMIGWDGLVSTTSTIFTFEKHCLSGHFCLLEELDRMKLVTMKTDDSKRRDRVGEPSGVQVEIATPFVLTGAAMIAAYEAATQEGRVFALGIQTDHQLRTYQAFESQLNRQPHPPPPIAPGRICDVQEHQFPELSIGKGNLRCQPEVHFYPAFIVVEQYISTVNYAHWLNEVGPKILLMRPILQQQADVFLLLQPNSWTLGWLDIAGIPRDRVVFTHPCILHLAERVYLTTSNALDTPAAQTIALTRSVLMHRPSPPSLLPPPAGAVPEVTFSPDTLTTKRAVIASAEPYIITLFRPPPAARSITNSKEVQQVIEKVFPKFNVVQCQSTMHVGQNDLGFKFIARFGGPFVLSLSFAFECVFFVAVDSSDYTLNETIALFNKASAVIGVIGAGFVNLIFSNPSTLAIQLIPGISHSRLACGVTPWWHLAELLGLSIRSFVIEQAHFHGQPFEVPIQELTKFLQSLKSQIKVVQPIGA